MLQFHYYTVFLPSDPFLCFALLLQFCNDMITDYTVLMQRDRGGGLIRARDLSQDVVVLIKDVVVQNNIVARRLLLEGVRPVGTIQEVHNASCT